MGKKKSKTNRTEAASGAPANALTTTTSTIAADPILGYRIRVLLHDFLSVTKDPRSQKRLNSTMDEHYISVPYFDNGQAAMVKAAIIDVDLVKHAAAPAAADDIEDIDRDLISQQGEDFETAVRTLLGGFLDKRRASGDARPCGPHHLAPLYAKFFGIDLEELKEDRRLANLNLGSLLSRNQTVLPRRTASRHNTRLLSNTRSLNMSNDDDYMAFLNKANQDTGAGAATQEKATFKTKDQGAQVPKPISDVCKNAVYTSDADEPFQEVSLKWEGKNGLPSESEFAKLIDHSSPDSADIKILDPLNWDSHGKYTDVIEAVREASQGNDVRVYQVTRDATRTEYWVVSHADGKLIGAKALSVES
ncbi:hypothetical protein FBULB1_3592 [Fusarium bulbicola]|nr:hypothetical protein FBULB1_3592 [Fusarium bulbicola]